VILLDDFGGFDTTSDPGFGDSTGMDGFMGVFWFFFVLVLVIGIGTTIWKITAARDMARRAGMDPDEATAMTVLTENGLEATYLASNLRSAQATPTVPPAQPARPVAERLAELTGLRDSGAITEAEYAERRQAIIDSV
jgi:hypothetical protein